MKKAFQLLTLTVLVFANEDDMDNKIHCVAGDFTAGNTAKINCYFPQNRKYEEVNVNIGHYPSFVFDETGNDVLACAWKKGSLGHNCFQKEGYFYDSFTNNTLTLLIPNVTKTFEGLYDCRLVSDESIRFPCNLSVSEKLLATFALSSVDVSSSNTGIIVGLTVGAVIIAILIIILFLFLRFRFMQRNRPASATENHLHKHWCCVVFYEVFATGTPTSSNAENSDLTHIDSHQTENECHLGSSITCTSPLLTVSNETLETKSKPSKTEMSDIIEVENVAEQALSNQTLDEMSEQPPPNQPLERGLSVKNQADNMQRLYQEVLTLRDSLEESARQLDEGSKFKKKAKIVGGSVGIFGSVVTAGLAAAPLTGGLSAVVATTGVSMAAVGGATTTISKIRCDKVATDKMDVAQKALEHFRNHLETYLKEYDKNGTLQKRLKSDGFLSSDESEFTQPAGKFIAVGRTVQTAAQTTSAAVKVLSKPVAFLGIIGAAFNIYDIIDGTMALHTDKKSSAGESIRKIISTQVNPLVILLEKEISKINVGD